MITRKCFKNNKFKDLFHLLKMIISVIAISTLTTIIMLIILIISMELLNVENNNFWIYMNSLVNMPFDYVLVSILGSIALIISFAIVLKKMDKSNIRDLGFHINKIWIQKSIIGFFTGFFLICLVFIFLHFTGSIKIISFEFTFNSIFVLLVSSFLWLGVAVSEETLFRGFIFTIINRIIGIWQIGEKFTIFAMIITSVIFSLFHIGNHGYNIMAFSNIFLAGLYLNYRYIDNCSLAFPIGFHFSWNLVQDYIFGYPVSGFTFVKVSLFKIEVSEKILLKMHNFGAEESMIATIIILAALVYYLYIKKIKSDKV